MSTRHNQMLRRAASPLFIAVCISSRMSSQSSLLALKPTAALFRRTAKCASKAIALLFQLK